MGAPAAIDQNRLSNGTYTFHNRKPAGVELSAGAARPVSDFTEQSELHQEAADAYFAGRPWNSAADFEDAFFDTYANEDEYYRDASNPNNGLAHVLDYVEAETLPSGAIAVFYKAAP